MGLSREIADRIKNAKMAGQGTPIRDGVYVLEIKKMICDNLFSGNMYITEFVVRECERVRPDIEPNAVGSTCSTAYNLDLTGKAGEATFGNVKNEVLAVLGKTEADLQNLDLFEELKRLNSPEQPTRGMLVGCETRRQKIQSGKNAGTEGVFPRFMYIKQTAAEIAERRKAQES